MLDHSCLQMLERMPMYTNVQTYTWPGHERGMLNVIVIKTETMLLELTCSILNLSTAFNFIKGH